MRRLLATTALALGLVAVPTASAEVRVALLDTGVNAAHEAFAPDQLVGFWDFATTARPAPGELFHPGKAPYDPNGHGTATAAMAVGAPRGETATRSFAPGTRFASAKVTTDTGSVSGDIAAAIRWAVDTVQADVINISIGTIVPVPLAGEHLWSGDYQAIEYARSKGVLVVVANGNGTGNVGQVPGYGPMSNYGGSTDTLAVGASGTRGAQVSYDPEIAAQYTVVAPTRDSVDQYRTTSGTSFSSPLVAGFAARLLAEAEAAGRTLSVDALETLVKFSARDTEMPPTWEGYGVIDGAQLDGAIAHARAGSTPSRPAVDPNAAYVETYQQNVRRINNARTPSTR